MNILNIPVIDICDINLLDQISSITVDNSHTYNSNINKLNRIKVICMKKLLKI